LTGPSLHGFKDAQVASTTTEIAIQTLTNLLSRRVWMFVQKVHSGDDHARSAHATLSAAARKESLLDGMQLFSIGDPFNRNDLGAIGLSYGNQAAVDEFTIDEDTAGAALSFTAAFLRPGQSEALPQNIQQPFHGIRLDIAMLPVNA
jgi:hypothetical protein